MNHPKQNPKRQLDNQRQPVPQPQAYPQQQYNYDPRQMPLQQPVYPPPAYPPPYAPVRVPPRRRVPGCFSCLLVVLAPLALIFVLLTAYFLAPLRTDLLILGIDRAPDGSALGRSDTIILTSVNPLWPTVKMLSIPRDLWVSIPDVGENRINTAHFFAEAAETGSGPSAAVRTVEQNFGIAVPYYVRLRFDAVMRIVDAFGGVTINLREDTAGLPAGQHLLNGEQALAFVRDRQGTDDFFRMEHAQLMVRAVAIQMISPASWPRLPGVAYAAFSSIDTNLPIWQWPRIGLAFVRAGISDQIDSRTIRREMTTGYITDNGANVLLPNWDLIRPMVAEMFAR